MEIVVMTMNVTGLTHREFRAILDEMGVEERPEPGIQRETTIIFQPLHNFLALA
jgi:hypothetical protein